MGNRMFGVLQAKRLFMLTRIYNTCDNKSYELCTEMAVELRLHVNRKCCVQGKR